MILIFENIDDCPPAPKTQEKATNTVSDPNDIASADRCIESQEACKHSSSKEPNQDQESITFSDLVQQ